MKISWEDAEKLSGGSAFFKIQDGEAVRVRFLYNKLEEMEPEVVHNVRQGDSFATVDCSRGPGDSVEACKWCAAGNSPKSVVIIPVFNIDTQEIQYWTRSATWVKKTLIPVLQEVPLNMPISGQPFKVKRTGKSMNDTSYTIFSEMNSQNDGATKESFGEMKDPRELNIIRPNDYEFTSQNNQNNNQSNGGFASTRRTTDVF